MKHGRRPARSGPAGQEGSGSARRPPLAGRAILLAGLRRKELAERLEALGARVESRPTIAVESPADPQRSRRILARLADYDLLVFTSVNGARSFAGLAGPDRARLRARVAAVGEATARALAAAGLPAATVARHGTAGALAAELVREGVAQLRVLVVGPERGVGLLPAELRRAGAEVDEIALYRTVASAEAASVARDVAAGRYEGIVFTSPSSFEALLAAASPASAAGLAEALARVRRVAIGPTTAGRLERAGLPADAVAASPSAEALAAAVVAAFAEAPVARASMAPLSAAGGRHPGPGGRAEPLEAELKRTPLYEEHLAAGARMVPFAGFLMPVQYAGVVQEHVAVRTKAGLFDVSHMGEIEVRGPQALPFLQRLTSNDVSRLGVGRAQYNALLNSSGGVVDDLLVYRTGDTDYLLVVNAANVEKDHRHLLAQRGSLDVEVADRSEAWGQLALQGPLSAAILQPLATADLAAIRSYAFVRAEVSGISCVVSRTGYTGEDGFELYAPAERTPELWRALLGAGAGRGLVPCGLGARDTLRLEARMLLYGNDMDETTTVLEADLGWILKLDKGDFMGREVLERQRRDGVERKLVGFEMEGRAIARSGYPVFANGRPAGRVTSGSFAPFLRKSIGLAYLPRGAWEPGTRFQVEIRGRRETAVVVPTPFYRRPR